MLNTTNYSALPYLDEIDFQNIEIERSFRTEEDALFSIYEQLFESREYINEEILLKAMKYLVFKKRMTEQMEEIRSMTIEDVCVAHVNQVNKEKLKISHMKKVLQEIAYF